MVNNYNSQTPLEQEYPYSPPEQPLLESYTPEPIKPVTTIRHIVKAIGVGIITFVVIRILFLLAGIFSLFGNSLWAYILVGIPSGYYVILAWVMLILGTLLCGVIAFRVTRDVKTKYLPTVSKFILIFFILLQWVLFLGVERFLFDLYISRTNSSTFQQVEEPEPLPDSPQNNLQIPTPTVSIQNGILISDTSRDSQYYSPQLDILFTVDMTNKDTGLRNKPLLSTTSYWGNTKDNLNISNGTATGSIKVLPTGVGVEEDTRKTYENVESLRFEPIETKDGVSGVKSITKGYSSERPHAIILYKKINDKYVLIYIRGSVLSNDTLDYYRKLLNTIIVNPQEKPELVRLRLDSLPLNFTYNAKYFYTTSLSSDYIYLSKVNDFGVGMTISKDLLQDSSPTDEGLLAYAKSKSPGISFNKEAQKEYEMQLVTINNKQFVTTRVEREATSSVFVNYFTFSSKDPTKVISFIIHFRSADKKLRDEAETEIQKIMSSVSIE